MAWMLPVGAQDPKQVMQQKVAAFQQSIAENQKALRSYTWTETTQIKLKGEVKSSKIESCRYGPDGKVQKTLLSDPPAKKEMRGLKKKIVEKKTEEMKDYMDRVSSLVHRYVPPQGELIQSAVAQGNLSFSPQGSDAILLQFKNYVKTGDLVSITLDTAAKQIRQFKVDTFLDEEKEKVILRVDFENLPDGIWYAGTKDLQVAAKEINVHIIDSNFLKLAM